MAASISNYSSLVTNNVSATAFVSNKKVFANGEVVLNGKAFNIGGSLAAAARKINKISKFTGVKADIKTEDNKQRLILVTFRDSVNIYDPKKILLNLYKTGKINNTDDSFIQVVSSKRRAGKINYTIGDVVTAKNLLKNTFDGADNVRYIKGTSLVVNPINVLNELDAPDEIEVQKDTIKNGASVPESLDKYKLKHGTNTCNPFDEKDKFDFSLSPSDVLWGIASIAYDFAKETVNYGYNTASSYLFVEGK